MPNSERKSVRYASLVSSVLLVIVFSGCDSNPRPDKERATDDRAAGFDIVGPQSEPLALISGSTPEVIDVFVARRVVPGEPYWSGMSVVAPAHSEELEVVSARPILGDGAEPVGVFIGRLGQDGGTGATPRTPPGDEFPGEPVDARGFVMTRDDGPYVVYTVARLDNSALVAPIYGAELVVSGADGKEDSALVVSATLLCSDPVQTHGECSEYAEDFGDQIYGLVVEGRLAETSKDPKEG